MDFFLLTAGRGDSGRRLDRIARRIFPGEPLPKIYEYIRKGLVRVNGKTAHPETRIEAGDSIRCAAFLRRGGAGQGRAEGTGFSAPDISDTADIPVLFKNGELLIVDKPRGILSHGKRGEFCVSEWVRAASVESQSLAFVPAPLHRLDKGTSGILVCSQSIEGARWFSLALKNRLIEKKYLALVQGDCPEAEWRDGISGGEARTFVKPLGGGVVGTVRVTLAEFTIATGRKHQIRMQSASRGFPLLGDTRYGGRVFPESRAFFLHAYSMRFPKDNPLDIPERITAPLPADFAKIAARLSVTGLRTGGLRIECFLVGSG
jgi:23S rRNA pseudouridine955/2504/2580 synthase